MASGDIYTLFEMGHSCDKLLERYVHTEPNIFCAAVCTMIDMYFKEKHIPLEEGWEMLTVSASMVHKQLDMK